MGEWVGMYFQEREKLTRSNLVNMLMTDNLVNKLMVLASRRVHIYGMLLVAYIWPVYLGFLIVNKAGIRGFRSMAPWKVSHKLGNYLSKSESIS